MKKGLRHSSNSNASIKHEHRYVSDTSHGYSVQQAIQQSSGTPDRILPMTSYMSEGDGDYRLTQPGNVASEEVVKDSPEPFKQEAGYDLNGIGAENLHDTSPNKPPIQGRGTRAELPLNTHPGAEVHESDYNQDGYKGFKFPQRFDGV